jgi:predicted hydrocarbon binding protein/KaiC/GvpD/RAD55 family RecA-like ATPase
MEARGLSLAKIQEVPMNSLILLAGPPGAGKSTFCHELVLNSLATERPIIFITTEETPSGVTKLLTEKGLGELVSDALSFVDAFTETVGVTRTQRSDTICANCADLNSLSMATTKLQERVGQKGILLAFDSLTSPYLFCGAEIIKFMRLFLAKFAAEGNSVVALMDEGCGKEEDLGAMMSIADGIIRMEIKENLRIVNVVKHPEMVPTKIETPMTSSSMISYHKFDPEILKRLMEYSISAPGKPVRTEVGDSLNVLWKNLASWSGMLWDPKRFPTMAYELDKQAESVGREVKSLLPWYMKLLTKIFIPKSFSEVKDMKRFIPRFAYSREKLGMWVWEYMYDISKKDEHYFRVYETSSCWGLDNVGAPLAFHHCGELAGALKGLEEKERDWNVVETKCIGLGDPYCEFKAVPGEIHELRDFLEGIDSSVAEKVHNRLMEQLTEFLVHGKPLPERPRLGSGVLFHEMHHVTVVAALFSERYRMALRMGGAMTGKRLGERLINAGIGQDEAIRRVTDFMEYCKVGKITVGETIRIKENCETFGLQTREHCCFFTTGFLNGLFSAVKNQHVREIKCVAVGDPYCEWEIV